MNGLVTFWNQYDPDGPRPFLHPHDAQYMDDHGGWQNWGHLDEMQRYLTRVFIEPRHYHFHLALQPFPFAGNLKKADVVILMLNPRFVLSEYYANAHDGYREALRRTMRQEFDGSEFPFVWLDPQFSWCDGFAYWEGKLREVLKEVAQEERFQGNYWLVLQEASRRIALIELVAYESVSFPQRTGARHLPSTKAAREAARTAAERARNRPAVVVGHGGYDRWELHEEDGVEIQNSRAFSLSRNSRARHLVCDRLRAAPGA